MCYRIKKDEFSMVIRRVWSRECTWVGIMGLKMCVGMSHTRCYFKNTTFFLSEKKLLPFKVCYCMKKDVFWMVMKTWVVM